MGTNYDWAALVITRCGITPTQGDCNNFVRWMAAENPPHDWWHLNNPLNASVGTGTIDGTGGYSDLNVGASYTAGMIRQRNMAPIYNALANHDSMATFAAGCAYSAWSTGGYHNNPTYLLNVPEPPPIMGPNTFPIVGVGPPPTPPPPPVPQYPKESNMITRNTTGQGYWGVRPNASVYTFDGAPYIGPHATWSASWGIGTPSNPIVGIVDDGNGGFALLADAGGPQPNIYNIPSDGRYASPKP
jgi:hypothetical protein